MSIEKFESWHQSVNAAVQNKLQNVVHGPFNEKLDELVLCFPANKVHDAITRHGDEVGSSFAIAVELGPYGELRPRRFLENNPEYIHPIVYFAVRQGGNIFVYSRGKSGGEDKLHDRASVGFGGHVCVKDVSYTTYIESFDVPEGITQEEYQELENSKSRKDGVAVIESLVNAFRREYKEEVNVSSYSGNPKSDVLAMSVNSKFLYHNTGEPNCVHGVHIGFLTVIDLPVWVDPAIFEPLENEGLGWYPISEDTINQFPAMEEWSKMVIRALATDTAYCMSVEAAEANRIAAYEQAVADIQQEEAIGKQLLDRINEQMPEMAELAEAAIDSADELVEIDSEEDDLSEEPQSLQSVSIGHLLNLAVEHGVDKEFVEAGTAVTYLSDMQLSETIIRLATDAQLPVEYEASFVDGFDRATRVTFPRGFDVAIASVTAE